MWTPRNSIFVIIAGMVLIAVSLWGMASAPPMPGEPAPAFTLDRLANGTYTLGDDRGNVRLIHFWATWCKPCKEEMPEVQKAYDQLKDEGFVVLAIDVAEGSEKVRQFVDRYGFTFPVLLDRENTVANKYGVVSLPVSIFVDETGKVDRRVKGGVLTAPKIRSIVDQITAESSAEPSTPSS